MKFFGTLEYYSENAPYLFSWQHFLLMGILIGLCIVLPFFLKKISPKAKWWTIFTLWLIEVVLEICKISIFCAVEGEMNFKTHIPIHISSWFMYVTPFYLWGKGKIKDMARAFLCTLNLFGGLCNFFIPTALLEYPVFSFFGLHTIIYHAIMVFVAILLWISEYRPQVKDVFWAFIPTTLASIICIPVDLSLGWNYMFYSDGTGTPLALLESLPQWLYTSLVFVGFFLITCLFVLIPMFIMRLIQKRKKRKTENL